MQYQNMIIYDLDKTGKWERNKNNYLQQSGFVLGYKWWRLGIL